jgi:DNA-binding response OmpR family regulator
MATKQKILIVDDDNNIAELISLYLTKECFECTIVNDGEEALRAVSSFSPDLILLDLMLPGMDGYEVCREVRHKSNVPIIMLSAKGEVFDKVLGLELGADDYLVKPFSPRELVARVRALLRRAAISGTPEPDVLDYGRLLIDVSSHKVVLDDRLVELTASEFKLLVTLARYPGRVYTRMELVERVLGVDFEGYERTIDSHVKNLRSKLKDDPKGPKWLFTVHGVGYRFEVPEDAIAKTEADDGDGGTSGGGGDGASE